MYNKPIICEPIIERWQDIQEEDIESVSNYLRTKPISVIDGGILSEFEQKYAEFIGAKYAVAYCNGTAALHAAAFAIGADKYSAIIMSEYGYHGTVNAVLENQSQVYLCDYDDNTLGIDCTYIKECIDESGKGNGNYSLLGKSR